MQTLLKEKVHLQDGPLHLLDVNLSCAAFQHASLKHAPEDG